MLIWRCRIEEFSRRCRLHRLTPIFHFFASLSTKNQWTRRSDELKVKTNKKIRLRCRMKFLVSSSSKDNKFHQNSSRFCLYFYVLPFEHKFINADVCAENNFFGFHVYQTHKHSCERRHDPKKNSSCICSQPLLTFEWHQICIRSC